MNPGQALEDATCLQVIQVMRRMSGLDLDAIATAMDRNRQTVGCWFGEASADKFIPLPLVPRFCHALGTPLLIEWLVAQYERCLREDPPQQWSGTAGATTGLLLRGLVQAGNALELLRDMGGTLSPSQGRQVSEAALLAVATLAAAAREARGAFPHAPKQVRFDRSPAGEADAAMAAAKPSGIPWWRRLGAWLGGRQRPEGKACPEAAIRRQALAAAEAQTLRCRTLVQELAGLVRDLLDHGLVPLEREPAARTLLDRADMFTE